jgi:photosystem II stability/assembly factor-like uncharacterized protein
MKTIVALLRRHLWLAFVAACLTAQATRGQDAAGLESQFLKAVKPRHIGPANMSGRVTDIAVVESRPSTMYVASASGGLWKTVNNGTTWKPVFERENTVALGAVAVSQSNPKVVWVGTGEANPRNSVSWGDGVYKSTDGGAMWKHMGLRDTHHIGRIVIHPKDPDIVYVAALGHLWGPNKERGLYKTVDGGQTWQLSKFISEDAGFVDVAMDPEDPNILYAAAWQVRRDAFAGGNPRVQTGPGSGLFRTTDGGATWEQMKEGLPERPLGRCGVSIYRKDPSVVYAVVQTDKTTTTVQGQPANKGVNRDSGGIFRSDDRGKAWKQINSLVPRPFYYGQIRVDPNNDKQLYVLGIQFHISKNGGKTFQQGNGAKGTHVDYHALWIDPKDPDHLVLGCDGGLNFSYDRSDTWEHLKNLPLGQFYAIGVDMRTPYRVYGGLQDNGSWGGPTATRDGNGITLADWSNILGFDGYYCQVDPKDNDTIYAEGQYGILRRLNVATGDQTDIKPRLNVTKGKVKQRTNIEPPPAPGTPGFRFNWNTPILLSPHNSTTIYYGGNFLFRSEDRGDVWRICSPDLTRGKPGPSPNTGHTITTIAESPLKKGLLYVGTDDGRVHITQDGGRTWTDLSERIPLPPERWITRVECSRFAAGTAYLSVDRHRNDDMAPYVFKTTDYGNSWLALTGNLPATGPVHVIREDPRNRNLLYVGTEFGLHLSFDVGRTWHKQLHLPTVPVHDLVVHPRDRELVIGTHGRSIYVMDVAPLQDLTPKITSAEAHLFEVKPATAFRRRNLHNLGIKSYTGQNPPYGASLWFYLRQAPPATPIVTISDANGTKVAQLKGAREAGLQRLNWNLNEAGATTFAFRPVPAGEYTATLRVGELALSRIIPVNVEE